MSAEAQDTASAKCKIQSVEPTKIVLVTTKDGPTEVQTFTFKDAKHTTLRWRILPDAIIVFQSDGKK